MSAISGRRPTLKFRLPKADEPHVRTTAPDARHESASLSADRGISLVEVMVAIALFAVMSSALMIVLNATIKTSNDGGQRVVAANLAARELEITRDAFTSQGRGPKTIPFNAVENPNPLPGGTAGQPLKVDGVPFTVIREAFPRAVDSAAASTCDEGTTAEMAYLTVRVTVTWPGLGDRPPLTMDTVMTPQKGTYADATKGFMGVKIIDRLGAPQPGVSVTRSGSATAAVTGLDGCALFANVTPGSYTVSVHKAGYVTQQGAATGTLTATVQAGQLWRGTVSYDEAATLEVALCPPEDYPLPLSLSVPVSLGNSGLLPSGAKSFSGTGTREIVDCRPAEAEAPPGEMLRAAETRTLSSLWPYPSGYQVWAGSCLDNDPQRPDPGTGQLPGLPRDQPVTSDPGLTSSTVVELVGLKVENAPLLSTSIVATQVPDTGCPKIGSNAYGAKIDLGPALLGGTIKASLPYGVWKITSGSKSATVTVVKGGGPVTARL